MTWIGITYEAAKGEKVIIKGIGNNFKLIPYKENVFSVTLNNELFGHTIPMNRQLKEIGWLNRKM